MKKIEKQEKLNTSNMGIVVKGTFIAWVITLILLFIYSCILAYTNVSDSTIPVVTIILTVISILIGSSLATHRIKNNGLLNGALVGRNIFIYNIFNFKFFGRLWLFIIYVCNNNDTCWNSSRGCSGGIAGVNMR